jgi:dihydropteroate synthase-like protein
MTEHILLLTGKLAEKSLSNVVESIDTDEFTFEVSALPIAVAGLMTAHMIVCHINGTIKADRIITPGLCLGDLEEAGRQLGIVLERGPKDIKDLPLFLGKGINTPDLSSHGVRIFAEIVDGPRLSSQEALARARSYGRDGADVIDLGCLPETAFPLLEEIIETLVSNDFVVSVDSMDTTMLMRGAQAGASYLLSLKESTLWVADKVDAIPVLIPESPNDMDSLFRAIDFCLKRKISFIADPIIDPIHFGFAESIVRYQRLRTLYPDIEIMMGTGNLTELTEADTGGINALLSGIMSELGISNLLTTQVSPHARRCVAELDLARRIMFRAKQDCSLPKGYHGGLASLHAREPFAFSDNEIKELAARVDDPNFRIHVTQSGIHIYNDEGFLKTNDPKEVFDRFPSLQKDASHAFYMGGELARARIALQLGKPYFQDNDLDWGCATDAFDKTKP